MSGKTTLLESLLYTAGAIQRKGSVKDGNTVGDSSPEARTHQMSVEVSVANVSYLNEYWTFIDCPGSVEFAEETISALMVADAAILVVEADPSRAPMTLSMLKFLDDHAIPHIIFLNKVDNLTEVNKIRETINALQPMSQHKLVLREYPINTGNSITGYEDLSLERSFSIYPSISSKSVGTDVTKDKVMTARQEMLEDISNIDDALMEKLLEEQTPLQNDVFATLTMGFRNNQIIPVMFGSAEKNLGIVRLLKQLRHEVPEVSHTAARLGIPICGSTNIVQVWKTFNVQHIGKQSLVRIWHGALSDETLLNGLRTNSISRPFGVKYKKIFKAVAGEVVALGRMDTINTGDTLTSGHNNIQISWPRTPQPMVAVAIKTADAGDEVKLSGALSKVLEEDQSYKLDHNVEAQERIIWGQGEIHLKVAMEKIKRLGINVLLGTPSVPYRETIRTTIKQHGRYKHQSGGHGAFGDVYIEIKPGTRGNGITFSTTIAGGIIPKNYIPAIEDGIRESCIQGPLGFPVVDVDCILYFGSFHKVDSSDMAFRAAARIAMAEGMPLCNPVLLEPILKIHISVPFEYTAKAQKIIISHRAGQILGFDAKENWSGWDVIDAYLPQSEMHNIVTELRSQTQGTGFFTWSFHHLQEFDGKDSIKIIEARKKISAIRHNSK